jgi:hypothetical protein
VPTKSGGRRRTPGISRIQWRLAPYPVHDVDAACVDRSSLPVRRMRARRRQQRIGGKHMRRRISRGLPGPALCCAKAPGP